MFATHMDGHAGMWPWQVEVRPVDQVLQDAVGQVLLMQPVDHRQARVCHRPPSQQRQSLRLDCLQVAADVYQTWLC